MSVVLTQHEGCPVVEIADAQGEVWPYRYAITAGSGEWSVRLTRLDPVSGEAQAAYVVRKRGDRWSCECPDFRWRFRAHRGREPGSFCKHAEAAVEMYRVWQQKTGAAS